MQSPVLPSPFRMMLLVVVGWLLVAGQASQAQDQTAKVLQYLEEARIYDTPEATELEQRKALALYAAALKVDPDRLDALFSSAQIRIKRQEYKIARALLTRAVRSARAQHPDKPEYEAKALNELGICYQKEGKKQDALKMYRRAKQKHRPLVEAHYNLINLLIMEKQFDEAEAAIAEAEEVAPSPLYRKFASWFKGKEGSQVLSGYGMHTIVIALIGGILLAFVLKRMRSGSTSRISVNKKLRRKSRRSGRPPNRRV